MKHAVAHLRNYDVQLRSIIDTYGLPNITFRTEGFESMCLIILEQQVSIASAKACFVKLEQHFGTLTPIKIANATEHELKNCGLSRQKISYVHNLSEKILSKTIDFEGLRNKTESEIRTALRTIKGVGNWSIDVYLLFCLQFDDVIPLGDIAIKNTMTELYNTVTVAEMEAVSALWKPHRSLATHILWHYYLIKRGRL